MTIKALNYYVPDSQIADLRARLSMTRWPDQAPDAPWSYGTDVSYLRELTNYWLNDFDWKSQEAKLNEFPQFMVPVAGINLHTLHVPGKGPNPKPLLLLHGWPGSVFEFIDIIKRLTDPAAFGGDPADAFTVVAPSLPGYGLSFQPGQKRFGVRQIADAAVELMSAFGYPRFGVQGGDWGSLIATCLGLHHPNCINGIHLNFLAAIRRDPALYKDADPETQDFLSQLKHFAAEESGYQAIQGTKPQTLAFALTDSPVGLAAWFVEKFRTWTDCNGNPELALSRDQMLADISFYWFTGSIGSSFWPYYERLHRPWLVPEGVTIDLPLGYAQFPCEILRPPRSVAEKVFSNIKRWSVMPKGGHFAAMEQPAALASEVTEFFRDVR
jgi:pimeloyl-ACP methyl ester carboxylesterase